MAEPVPVMVRRYECPFCHRRWAHKAAVITHMARCWLNPAVRSCRTCAHFDFYPGGEPCFPGRPCDCNDASVECAAGVSLSFENTPQTQCPLWVLAAGRGARHA